MSGERTQLGTRGRRAATAIAFALAAASGALFVGRPLAADEHVNHGRGLAARKATTRATAEETPALLATLVQTHTEERVPLDGVLPDEARFDALLADRITGKSLGLDPRLVDLLRRLAPKYAHAGNAPRIELVSGFRSPKLNEMLRKKGHHVASHSQHSLGHAVDFRIVPVDDATDEARPVEERAVDPRVLERDIRALGWQGGVGVYTSKGDWFVHADVGPNRRWRGT